MVLADPLREGDALSIPFVLKNEGHLPIYSVLFSCRMNRVRSNAFIIDDSEYRSGPTPIEKIRGGGNATIPCFMQALRGAMITEAVVEVAISFRHALLPWHTTEVAFAFEGLKTSSGRLRLSPRPN